MLLRRACRGLTRLGALLLCAAAYVSAQSFVSDDDKQKSLTDLSLDALAKVEVTTVNKQPQQVWRTPAAIYVMTSEDIRRSGATTIPELLRYIPGVYVGQTNANQWSIGVRGFTNTFSRSLLVLIDGRNVYTPLFGGVYWHVQDLLLEDIDRIEVIRGPGGTAWGANAVNGVINIITKKAKDTKGELAKLRSGNVENLSVAGRVGGSIGKVDWRVYGKDFVRGPQWHPDRDNYDDWHMQRAGFRADWQARSQDSVSMMGDFYGGITPRRVGLVDTKDPVSGGNVMLRWEHQRQNGTGFYVQTYVDRTVREGFVGGEVRNTFDLDFSDQRLLGERNRITYGGELRFSPNRFSTHEDPRFLDITPHDDDYHDHSVYVQDEIALVQNKLDLTLGEKAEHNHYTGWESMPTARLLWSPTEHQSLWAAVTRAVRIPSRLEDGFRISGPLSTNPPLYILITGSRDFKPEVLVGYEAGYRKLFTSNLYVDVAAYYNDYDNLQGFSAFVPGFDALLNAPVLEAHYANTIKGNTKGFEITPDWKVRSWLRVRGSYSYLHYNLEPKTGFNDQSNISTYVGSHPHHEGFAQAQVDLGRGFEFDPSFRAVGKLPAQGVNSYQTMDARLGWRHGEFEFAVVGQNLLQPHHPEFGSGDPQVPTLGIRRSVFGSIIWRRQ